MRKEWSSSHVIQRKQNKGWGWGSVLRVVDEGHQWVGGRCYVWVGGPPLRGWGSPIKGVLRVGDPREAEDGRVLESAPSFCYGFIFIVLPLGASLSLDPGMRITLAGHGS